jgi:hypothetical protein
VIVVDPSELTTVPSDTREVVLYPICRELIEAPPFDPSVNDAMKEVLLRADMTGLLGADGVVARSIE